MDTVMLSVKKRETSGSRRARVDRRAGKIPAILYGHGMKPLSLEVERLKLIRALHTKAGENVVIDLDLEGEKLKESTCLVKALQHNPVTDEIQHVDFTVISLKEKIEVKVSLVTQHASEALGVKEGGILDVVHHEIPIECLPTQIPERFVLDVKKMKIGDALHVSDLKMPEGVVCKLDAAEVLVALHAPKKVEEEVPVAEAATQPEVIEKGKKEEPEEKAAAEQPSKKE